MGAHDFFEIPKDAFFLETIMFITELESVPLQYLSATPISLLNIHQENAPQRWWL
jgi:hypothetical protein